MDADETEPEVVFFGVAERAHLVSEPGTNLVKWNVLGLKPFVLVNFLPLGLGGHHLALAVRRMPLGAQASINALGPDGSHLGSFNLGTQALADPPDVMYRSDPIVAQWLTDEWSFFVVPLPPGIVVGQEGTCRFVQVTKDGAAKDIGPLQVILVDPPPLTDERIVAIKSDPSAVKGVRITIGCQKCPSKVMVYSALEKTSSLEEQGYQWYQDIPEDFICQCGSTRFDLRSMRKNLFAALGQQLLPSISDVSQFLPLYEHAAFEHVRVNFSKLLDKDPDEEEIQRFIEDHPILLHQFPAVNIFFKPPLLNLYKADFAILSPQRELILIEIEKASTRLLKKDGGTAAPLTHAFDQVRDWLHVANEHRLAVLDGLKINRDLVSVVKGVVIAGREKGLDAGHLRKLKGAVPARVALLTYDDLVYSLRALSRQVSIL